MRPVLALLFSVLSVQAVAHFEPEARKDDLRLAPPGFEREGAKFVPSDIEKVELRYRFDLHAGTAEAHARVLFRVGDKGFPLLDLVPAPHALKLNGKSLALDKFPRIEVPGDTVVYRQGRVPIQPMRAIQVVLKPRQIHELEISYEIPKDLFDFSDHAVRMLFDMDDLHFLPAQHSQHFWEAYAPANLEFDQFPTEMRIEMKGNVSDQLVISNGKVSKKGKNKWEIRFPKYFTSSSYYLHLADRTKLRVERYYHRGAQRKIPVLLYMNEDDPALMADAKMTIRESMEELEENFGPYAHPSLIVYLTGFDGGGMEHNGATITTYTALSHEISHMWFARGVMPAGGNSGWIDEAFATWRDEGYQTANQGISSFTTRFPFGVGSLYRRDTNLNAYQEGPEFFAALDFQLSWRGGLKGALRKLYLRKVHDVIDSKVFEDFLSRFGGASLEPDFSRIVFGLENMPAKEPRYSFPHRHRRHPRGFSRFEIRCLR